MSEGRAQRTLAWLSGFTWNEQSVGEKRVKDNGQDELGEFGEGGKGDLGCKILREI